MTSPWTARRRIASTLTVLGGAAAVLATASVPAHAAVTQTASCLDGGGVRWNAKVVWDKTYRAADGVTKVTVDYAGWTTTKTGTVPTDARIRTYDAAGHRLQDKIWQGSMNYGGGATVMAVNPVNPPSAPGEARVTLTLGVAGDGKASCSVTLRQPAATPAPTTPGPTTPSASDAYENDVIAATNVERTSRSLVTLTPQACVDSYAEAQAQRMATEDRMYHQDLGPVMAGCALRMAGENVAYGFPDGEAVTAGWMASPGHRANILKPEYRLLGVGAAQNAKGVWYSAQVFGTLS